MQRVEEKGTGKPKKENVLSVNDGTGKKKALSKTLEGGGGKFDKDLPKPKDKSGMEQEGIRGENWTWEGRIEGPMSFPNGGGTSKTTKRRVREKSKGGGKQNERGAPYLELKARVRKNESKLLRKGVGKKQRGPEKERRERPDNPTV